MHAAKAGIVSTVSQHHRRHGSLPRNLTSGRRTYCKLRRVCGRLSGVLTCKRCIYVFCQYADFTPDTLSREPLCDLGTQQVEFRRAYVCPRWGPLQAVPSCSAPSKCRWHVRRCEMGDVKDMAEIQFQGFHMPQSFFLFEALSQMNFRAEVTSTLNLKMIQPDGYRCLVVEGADGAAGGIADISIQQNREVLGQLPPDTSTYAYLSSMAVAEHLRRQGAARALLIGAEKAAWAWKQTHLALHLHEDNEAARKLYERAGFRQASRRTPFLGRTRLLMLKAVRP